MFSVMSMDGERAVVLLDLLQAATSGVDMTEVIDAIGEELARLLEFDRLSVVLPDPESDYVVWVVLSSHLRRVPRAGNAPGRKCSDARPSPNSASDVCPPTKTPGSVASVPRPPAPQGVSGARLCPEVATSEGARECWKCCRENSRNKEIYFY